MVSALAADFGEAAGIELHTLRDHRLADADLATNVNHEVHDRAHHWSTFSRLAECAHWTLVIAPEIDGLLLQASQRVVAQGGRLLSPDPAFIELASDKRALHRVWSDQDVPVPCQRELAAGEFTPRGFPYPAVVKPADGAGSLDVRLVASSEDESGLVGSHRRRCLQSYCRGKPASVAVLSGPKGFRLLPPCRQMLSHEGQFRYLGGRMPIATSLATRASRLAEQVIASLPPTRGYYGIDLILGEAPDGSQDVAIEVNPRMTTSYVGLCQSAQGSLAAAMLAIASGEEYPVSFDSKTIEFSIA